MQPIIQSQSFVFINDNLCFGGVETVIVSFARHLVDLGHHVTIVIEQDVQNHELDKRIELVNLGHVSDEEKEKAFLSWAEGKHFDFAIAPKAKQIVLLSKTNPSFATKKIGSIHGFGECLENTPEQLQAIGKMDCITVLTEENRKFYRPYNPNTVIARNILDLYPNDPTIERKKIIACVSRLDFDKHPEWFIKAAARIRFQCPGWEFHIVGNGTRHKIRELKRINALRLFPVKFFSGMQPAELSKYYQSIEILAFCSEIEGFPNTLIEAAYYGCARVSTEFKGGALPILVQDKVTGLVTSVSSKSLAKGLLEIVKNEELRHACVKNAKAQVDELLKEGYRDWEKVLGIPLL